MADFTENKITSEDLADKGVVGLADTPGLPYNEMQAKFDELVKDVVVPKFNELCDTLEEEGIDGRVASEDITNIRKSADDTLQVSTDGGDTYQELSSSGHVIVNGAGVSYAQRSRLQFSDNVVITDKPEDSATFLSIPPGEKGDRGDAATIQVGNVQSGETASVVNSGSSTDAIFNFTLPKGDDGSAATIQVGTVTSGANASVSNRGTSSAAIFDFVLPKGDKGDTGQGINILGEYATLSALEAAHPIGNPGNAYMVGASNPKDLYIWDTGTSSWANQGELQGAKGDQGDAGTITVGTVTSGDTVAVENVGTSTAAVFNFTLKKGDKGDTGNAATIAVGTVTGGSTASVTNSGTSSAAVFDFVLPKGDTGAQGNPTVVNGKSGASITLGGGDIAMTSYSKPASTSAIATSDTINDAVGKLEYKADANATSISTNTSAIADINAFHTFTIETTDWGANSDVSTSTDYPYVATVTTAYYSDDSTPTWQMNGVGDIPTATERTSIDMVLEALFDDNGVTLYATDEPTVDLVLEVKGV